MTAEQRDLVRVPSGDDGPARWHEVRRRVEADLGQRAAVVLGCGRTVAGEELVDSSPAGEAVPELRGTTICYTCARRSEVGR